jgi:hypothetical protein
MQQCCTNCLKACEPLADCPDSFVIKLPLNYGESDVIIEITKPGVDVVISQLLEVFYPSGQEEFGQGYAEIDLAQVPQGFFNPWGGIYQLKFISAETGKVWEFVGCDGVTYDSICLTFIKKYTNAPESDLTLNVFIDCQYV